MAEREGFEPSERGHRSTVFNGFQDRRIQPLCHLSKAVISYLIIQFCELLVIVIVILLSIGLFIKE